MEYKKDIWLVESHRELRHSLILLGQRFDLVSLGRTHKLITKTQEKIITSINGSKYFVRENVPHIIEYSWAVAHADFVKNILGLFNTLLKTKNYKLFLQYALDDGALNLLEVDVELSSVSYNQVEPFGGGDKYYKFSFNVHSKYSLKELSI